MGTPEDAPKTSQDLIDDGHQIATDAVDSVEEFVKSLASLPPDLARLGLDTIAVAARNLRALVLRAGGGDQPE